MWNNKITGSHCILISCDDWTTTESKKFPIEKLKTVNYARNDETIIVDHSKSRMLQTRYNVFNKFYKAIILLENRK